VRENKISNDIEQDIGKPLNGGAVPNYLVQVTIGFI